MGGFAKFCLIVLIPMGLIRLYWFMVQRDWALPDINLPLGGWGAVIAAGGGAILSLDDSFLKRTFGREEQTKALDGLSISYLAFVIISIQALYFIVGVLQLGSEIYAIAHGNFSLVRLLYKVLALSFLSVLPVVALAYILKANRFIEGLYAQAQTDFDGFRQRIRRVGFQMLGAGTMLQAATTITVDGKVLITG